ncbi:MAG: acyltransferase family protein [Bryobacteraceae bacterium]
MSESTASTRLSPLDGLRGLASLIIVILHYRNLNDKWNETIINTNPFWDQLILVYKFGWMGVEFFFVLSGFIFYWKYGEMISEKAITLTNFAILRLSRLYPLHVATLFLTAFLQYLVWSKSSTTFVYGNNDIYHLLLQLTFLNYGWVEFGHSFNAPAWSIALEMGLYFLFYAVCFGRKNRPLVALGLMMLFLHVHIRGPIPNFPMLNEPFTRVGYCFFMGGLLHFIYSKVKNAGKIMEYAGFASLMGIIVILYCIQSFVIGNAAMAQLIGPRFNTVIAFGVFPMLITCGMFFPPASKLLSTGPLRLLGDISYSMYLIHFPIQIAFYYFTLVSGPVDFKEKSVFWTYIAIVLGLAYLSHFYFEKPAMKWLRARLVQRDTPVQAAIPEPVAEVAAT